MQKDRIYIEVDDEITDIIGKIKASKNELVVLIPPKRAGVLQSAVNLRLLQRAATQKDKHLVIVTSSVALASLAGAAGIPTAKTLRSKPEIVQKKKSKKTDDDVIDGKALPVTEHAKHVDMDAEKTEAAHVVEDIDVDEIIVDKEAISKDTEKQEKKKKPVAIPDFSVFRKRFFIALLLLALLAGGLVWAIVYAPKANITVHMKTSPLEISQRVIAKKDAKVSVKDTTIPLTTESISQSVSIKITPTGEKDAGEYATGAITTSALAVEPIAIPAGTAVRASGGSVYRTAESVTIPASTLAEYLTTGAGKSVSVGIRAVEPGELYNGAQGTASIGISGVTATFSEITSGGTTRIVKVVTQTDIDKASQEIAKQTKSDAMINELKSKMNQSALAIVETFKTDTSAIVPSIKADAEVEDGVEPALKGSIVYSMSGVQRKDIVSYLDTVTKQAIDGKKFVRIHDTGADGVKIENVQVQKDSVNIGIVTTAKVGPELKKEQVLERAKGKKSGELRQELTSIQGVSGVDVELSPFWVSSVPDDEKKVSVEFILDDE